MTKTFIYAYYSLCSKECKGFIFLFSGAEVGWALLFPAHLRLHNFCHRLSLCKEIRQRVIANKTACIFIWFLAENKTVLFHAIRLIESFIYKQFRVDLRVFTTCSNPSHIAIFKHICLPWHTHRSAALLLLRGLFQKLRGRQSVP